MSLLQIANQMWPDITSYVTTFIKDGLEPKVKAALPARLKSFCFQTIDLGDLVRFPLITLPKTFMSHRHTH